MARVVETPLPELKVPNPVRISKSNQCDDHFEREALRAGHPRVAGLDEVGRGCLFGPVAAAAVVLDLQAIPLGIDDSKKLSIKHREKLADEIKQAAIDFAIAFVDSTVVDRINILEATREAMKRAVRGLKQEPSFLLCDGIVLSGISIAQLEIIKGDALSVSIAAASILAKVARDELLDRLALDFPGYELEKNKGYGTARHLEALRRLGPTPLHRRTFKGVLEPMVNLPFVALE
jgi:ribonuclease HII